VVDTTVQEKAVAHPTDARLAHPRSKAARSANARVSDCTRTIGGWPSAPAIMDWRYTRALQLKRARRQLKFLHKRSAASSADLRRKIEGSQRSKTLGPLLDLAWRVRPQEPCQRGLKIYSLHAPRCIGRGKGSGSLVWRLRRSPRKGRAVLAVCQDTGRQILTTVMQSVSSSPTLIKTLNRSDSCDREALSR